MKSDLRRMIRLEFLGFLSVLILFFIFDFYPNLRAASRLEEKIRLAGKIPETVTQPEMEREKSGLEKELSQNKENLEFLRQAVDEFQSKIVQEKNIPLITQEVVDIAASSRIELGSVKPLPLQVKDGHEILPIEIRFQCGYTELIDFLSKGEASFALATIQNLSIKRDEALPSGLDISLTACAIFTSENRGK